jgi:copper homeostasis protein
LWKKMPAYEIEVCVDTLDQALNAERQGATRIELCSRLDLDGLTPGQDLILDALSKLNIPIHVMIRPRAGDFTYNPEEIGQMESEILFCKNKGVPGVVFGVLTPEGALDLPLISHLAHLAKPMNVVIHKAIDQTANPLEEFKKLVNLDLIDFVLTSGGYPTAAAGLSVLKDMIKAAKGKPRVIVAGKVTQDDLADLHQKIQAKDYHGRLIVGRLD